MSKCKPSLDGDKIKRIHVRAKANAAPPKTAASKPQGLDDKSKQAPAVAESQQSK